MRVFHGGRVYKRKAETSRTAVLLLCLKNSAHPECWSIPSREQDDIAVVIFVKKVRVEIRGGGPLTNAEIVSATVRFVQLYTLARKHPSFTAVAKPDSHCHVIPLLNDLQNLQAVFRADHADEVRSGIVSRRCVAPINVNGALDS